MQKTIFGFYQEEAKNMGLDLVDLLLLRWFINFSESNKMVSMRANNRTFYWVNYKGAAENYPILNLKKDAIYRHFKKMADKGILERHTVKKGGTFSLYRIGLGYARLIDIHDRNRYMSITDNAEPNIYGGKIYAQEQREKRFIKDWDLENL